MLIGFLILAFATVGLVVLVRWIPPAGLGYAAKTAGLIAVVGLWWAIGSEPYGKWSGDRILADLVTTFGIAIAGTWGLRRVGNDWRLHVAVIGWMIILLGAIWVPRIKTYDFSTTSFTSSSVRGISTQARSVN